MLEITSPNGGESWDAWTYHDITWLTAGPVGNVMLEYSKDDFVSDVHLIAPDTENDGTFSWFVVNDPTTNAKVRVSEVDKPLIFDISDDPFTINLDSTPIWPYAACDEKGTCRSLFNGTTSTNIKWTYNDEQVRTDCVTIGLDGTIYCPIYIPNPPPTTKRSPGLSAINPVDGSEIWRHYLALGNYSARTAAVSPDGQYVYYGGDNGTDYGCRGILYCLDASDGSEVWSYTLPNTIASQYETIDGCPKLGPDGSVYFQSLRPNSGYAHAWGLNSNGTYKWHHSINGYGLSHQQYHCPSLGSDDRIYVTDSVGQLFKFDFDGNSLWPAVYVYYHTTYNGLLDNDNNFYVACDDGRDVNKFAPNGDYLWTTLPWDFYLHCSPAQDSDGYIYATGGWDSSTSGYRIRKMDPDNGATIWEHSLGAITTARMAISADEYIYIGCGNGSNGAELQIWDTDGNHIDTLDLDEAAGSPVIGPDGTIYFASGHELYAMGS